MDANRLFQIIMKSHSQMQLLDSIFTHFAIAYDAYPDR